MSKFFRLLRLHIVMTVAGLLAVPVEPHHRWVSGVLSA